MWRSILKQTLHFMLPQNCFACAQACHSEVLCAACAQDLQSMVHNCCPSCALPSMAGQLCGRCIKRLPPFDATLAAFAYAFPVREMIHALKYAHRFGLAQELGAALTERCHLNEPSPPPDVVVPMPLHASRMRERGFNQAHELAKYVARAKNWRLLTNSVQRIRPTPTQTGLKLLERRRNLRGAFVCKHAFNGLHVLVVDDVMTTGMTLAEVARTLKANGAARVSNLVVARTLEPVRK